MKKMKKLLAVFLAAMMILAMNLNVFASEPSTKSTVGSISISNPMQDQTYDIYLMFELVSYNGNAYLYKISDGWKAFVTSDTVGSQFFEIYATAVENGEEVNYVRAKDPAPDPKDYSRADLAKAALEYAKNNQISKVIQLPIVNGDTKSYTVSNLEKLGYYVIDSSAGALCSLTTTDPSALVDEKNTAPTVEKLVLEQNGVDGEGNPTGDWRESNDVEIGDTVYFKTEIKAMPGAHNYILHDRMGDGLTFDKESIEVYVGNSETPINGYFVGTFNEVAYPELENDEAYTAAGAQYYVLYDVVNTQVHTEVCDFEVHFTENFLETIVAETTITVKYSAKLNEQAKIHSERNVNATQLEYGDAKFTTQDQTYTHTYMFDLIKTGSNNVVLEGAEFKIYRATTAETAGAIEMKDEDGNTVYLEAEAMSIISLGNGNYVVPENPDANHEHKIIKAGNVRLKGFDQGTYYLVEETAPAGYNKVNYAIEVAFEEVGNTKLSGNILGTTVSNVYESGGVRVINNTGTLLPETGGTGRVILYTAGSLFTVAAVVVIVTKKRMKFEK